MPGQNALRCQRLRQTVDAVPPKFKHVLRFRQAFDLCEVLFPPACDGFLKGECLVCRPGADSMVVLIWSLEVMVGENAAWDGHSCPSLRLVLDVVVAWEAGVSDKNVQPTYFPNCQRQFPTIGLNSGLSPGVSAFDA